MKIQSLRSLLLISSLAALTACATDSQPPAQTTQTTSSGEEQIEKLTVSTRANAGVPAIRRSARLDAVARLQAVDMASNNFFSHTGSNGSTLMNRIDSVNYNACLAAENIAFGRYSEEILMEKWMDSPGHRRNMLHPNVREYGFAKDENSRFAYWVMVYARPC